MTGGSEHLSYLQFLEGGLVNTNVHLWTRRIKLASAA